MRKKLIVIVGITLAGVLALVIAAVSLLVNVDRFRPQFARAMSAALGREVAIGHISLSLLSGSAVVEDLSIAEDPAFGHSPFVTAKAVRVGIAMLPLVTSKHLRVESFRLQEPRLTLRRSAAGTWNFSTLGASSPDAPRGATSSSASNLTFSIDRLTIANGEIVIETPSAFASPDPMTLPASAKASARSRRSSPEISANEGGRRDLAEARSRFPASGGGAARTRPPVYKDVNVYLSDFSLTTPFRFAISMATPGGGALELGGHAGPFSAGGLGSTPFDASLNARGLDVARCGLVDAAAGLAGVVGLRLRIASNGTRITSSGTLHGDKVQVVPGALPASRPIDVAYASEYDLSTHDGVVTRGDVHIGEATARLLGRFSTRRSTPAVHLTLVGQHMPVTDLQALLPAIGATLPRGARFRSGSLDANLTASGPLDRLVIAGPLLMSDATLAGFDLGSRMQAVASLVGLRPNDETTIQKLGVTLRVAPEGIRAEGLTCVVPTLGSLDGAGTIAPNGALDFKMLGILVRTAGVAADLARMASLGRPEKGVPFRIAGTTASPVFVPDVGRAAADAIKDRGVSKATGFLRSLFNRNKR